jgi:hypothetical protein
MIVIVVWLLCGIGCLLLAQNKNKNAGLALVMGLLFGVFALIYYAVSSGEPSTTVPPSKGAMPLLPPREQLDGGGSDAEHELERLARLKEKGLLTEQEYEEKRRALVLKL